MALPSAVARQQGEIAQYGIRFTITPLVDAVDWQLCDVEIQRAPDSAGSPDTGNAEVVQRIGPIQRSGTPYTDYLPNDGVRRHYRWRHVRVGYQAGAWSSWLRTPLSTGTYGAKPVPLPIIIPKPDVAQLVGALVFSAASPPTVGSPAGSAYLSRDPAGIPYTMLRAEYGSAVREDFSTYNAMYPDSAGVTHYAAGGVTLPQGATLVNLDVRMFRQNLGDTMGVTLWRLQDDGTQTSIAATTAFATAGVGTTGWLTETVDCGSHVVTTGQYQLRVVFTSATNRQDTRFRRASVSYKVPNLGVGL